MQKILKSKFIVKRKKVNPGKRWGHSAVLKDNYLYIIAGNCNKKITHYVYRLHCPTYQFQPFQCSNSPQNRDSHCSVLINNTIYTWGGSINQASTNQLWALNQNSWVQLNQFGDVPIRRQGHSMIVLQNRWILMFGGLTCQQEQFMILHNDFHLLDTKTMIWKKIKILKGEQISIRENSTLSKVGEYIYLFGGLESVDMKEVFLNDLYKIKIKNFDFSKEQQPQMLIQKLLFQNKNKPPQRAQHTSLSYNNQFLIIIGGQGKNPKSDQKQNNNIYALNDFWVFDTKNQIWGEIIPKGRKSGRFNFTANVYEDKIILYGGMQSQMQISDQLGILMFQNEEKIIIKSRHQKFEHICINCKESFNLNSFPRTKFNQQQSFQISHSFIYSASSLVKSSEQALTILIDYAVMNGQEASVNLREKQNFKFVVVEYNKSELIEFKDWYRFCEGQFMNVRLAAFYLGLSYLYISRDGELISVSFFSSNDKLIPSSSSFHPYIFSYNPLTTQFISEKGSINRKIIQQSISPFLTQEDFQSSYKIKIIIFDLKTVQGILMFKLQNWFQTLAYQFFDCEGILQVGGKKKQIKGYKQLNQNMETQEIELDLECAKEWKIWESDQWNLIIFAGNRQVKKFKPNQIYGTLENNYSGFIVLKEVKLNILNRSLLYKINQTQIINEITHKLLEYERFQNRKAESSIKSPSKKLKFE